MKQFRALSSLSAVISACVARHTSNGQSQPQQSIPVSSGPPNIPPPYVNQAPKPKLFSRRTIAALKTLRPEGRWNPNQKQKRKDRRRAFAAGNSRAFK
jgi:hypothetical protein